MLTLPIKKQWFDMIFNNIKLEEYREIKPYYTKRFQSIGLLDTNGKRTYERKMIALRNGYSANSPMMYVDVTLDIGKGKTDWGAVKDTEYYILNILEIRSCMNISKCKKDGD